jgi:putative hydrolase of the HAD superfamily
MYYCIYKEDFMIFFDLDGTLVDHDYAVKQAVISLLKQYKLESNLTEEEVYTIWNEALERNYELYLQGKLTHSEQRIKRFSDFYSHFGIIISEVEAEEKLLVYLKEYEKNWVLYEDAMDCLKALKGQRLGIISNGFFGQQIKKLENTGIRDYFEVIITSSEIGKAKPHKDIFEQACINAGMSLGECTYIGDRWEVDAIGAKSAGMKSIWIDRNNIEKKEYEGIYTVSSLVEVISLLY